MSLYENKEPRMPLERVAIPENKHFKLRNKYHALLNNHNPKGNLLSAVFGYVSLFGTTLLVLALTYQGLPALLEALGAAKNSFWYNLVYGLLGPVLMFLFVAVVALINILMLRKYLAKVQNRYGPLHHGPAGVLQTVFDALKLVSKEDFAPAMVEETIFTLAPVIVFVSAFIMIAVMPFAPGWVFSNVDSGALFIIAAGTLGGYGVLLAGWSMNNKYGLMGGLRAAAQLVSYEVPLSIALLSVVVYTGSMNLTDIIEHQKTVWHVFPLFIPFVIYLIAGLAEIKMTPFDLPEAESELVAGFNTEYGGMRFGFFFVAEFAELYLLPAILAIFFLGGWHAPSFPIPQNTIFSQWAGGSSSLELVLRANLNPIDLNKDWKFTSGDQDLLNGAIDTTSKTGVKADVRFDLNADGQVNPSDQILLQEYVDGKQGLTWWQLLFGSGSLLLNLQYAFWSLLKAAAGVYFYMWIRATLPRFRDDQLMELCWKGLIPLSMIGLLLAAVSRLYPVIGQILSYVTAIPLLLFIVSRAFGLRLPSPKKELA
jgi:NADH-quinone oxidoreductase subunit H